MCEKIGLNNWLLLRGAIKRGKERFMEYLRGCFEEGFPERV